MWRRQGYLGVVSAAVFCLAAHPYEDTQGRFRLELADRWEIMPQFGDLAGMTFRRVLKTQRGEAPALLLVHVDGASASSPKEYADVIEADLKKQEGFARLGERSGMVGGHPALVREYRMLASKKPRIEKQVRAYYLEGNGHLYQIHFESTPRGMQRVDQEVSEMLESFKPLPGRVGKTAKRDAEGIEASSSPQSIAGRWVNDDGLMMALGDDHSFVLDETAGRYEVVGDKLTMIIPGKGRETFTFKLDATQKTLTLSSPNLGSPMTYRRTGEGGSSAGPVAPGPTPAEHQEPSGIEGEWLTPTAQGVLSLELGSDQTFTMGSMTGKWLVAGKKLILTQTDGKAIEYKFLLKDGQLRLSGGDLDEPVVFSRSQD